MSNGNTCNTYYSCVYIFVTYLFLIIRFLHDDLLIIIVDLYLFV